MVMEMLKHWESAVDGIQILLCLLVLILLVRNHRHQIKVARDGLPGKSGQAFSDQVVTQSIQQQVELAFANILNVAASEHRNLGKLLQFHTLNRAPLPSPESPSGLQPVLRDDNIDPVEKRAGLDERQARVAKLATQGMSAKQISEALNIATGEVELILSLQKP